MKVVYVAGPFRGPHHWAIAENIHRAERLALKVWLLGAAAICPHANTAHFQDAAPDHVWLDGDLEILSRCDAVIFTPDYRRSAGALAELEHAQRLGIPTFFDVQTLNDWLHQETIQPVHRATDLAGHVIDGP